MKITLTEENFISLLKNNLTFKNIKILEDDLFDLISGDIIEKDNNLICLQDIGFGKILSLLDKYYYELKKTKK